jgi:hypothetical protein
MGLPAAPFSLSAGGGGLLGYTFTRYTLEAEAGSDGHIKSVQTMDRFNYGGFLFLDGTYGVFAVSFRRGQNSYEETIDTPYGNTNDIGAGTEMALGFSLLGKYPFRLTQKITWFPLLGVEYQMALLEQRTPQGDTVHDRSKGELAADLDKDGKPYALSAWNSLTVDLGAGLDYQIKGPLFVRNEFLFSIRLETPYETGAKEMTKHQFNASDIALAGLTGSPTLRTSVGYRFTDR